jgi:hypothetical protein
MSEQKALVLAGGAQASSSKHTPSASEKLYIHFKNEQIPSFLKTCPAFISCQSALAVRQWISSCVGVQVKRQKDNFNATVKFKLQIMPQHRLFRES